MLGYVEAYQQNNTSENANGGNDRFNIHLTQM
jgi:hypothetical protein